MLIFRYPVSKSKISKYLDISRYLLGHFSIAYSMQFGSFLCWVQSFDSDKSYSMIFSFQVQIAYIFGWCAVVILNWRTSFAYSDAREATHVWEVEKDLYSIYSNSCLILRLLTISEKENLPLAWFLAIPLLRSPFLWEAASDSWIVDWSDPEFTLVPWVV